MDCLVEALDRLVLQVCGVSEQLLDVFLRHVAFSLYKVLAILRQCEFSEEIRLNRMLEESVLSLLGVVVHTVTKNRKIDIILLSRLHQEEVVFVVSVSINERHHALKKHVGLHVVKLAQNGTIHKVDEACHNFVHSVLRNRSQVYFGQFRLAVIVFLVLCLVELIHGPEASPQKEKVELLYFFILLDNNLV